MNFLTWPIKLHRFVEVWPQNVLFSRNLDMKTSFNNFGDLGKKRQWWELGERVGQMETLRSCPSLFKYEQLIRLASKALDGWLSWLEHRLVQQRVVGSVPSRCAYRRQPIDVSLFLSIFYWLCYYSCPNFFSPLYLPPPCTPPVPLTSSCPWVVHISSLASPFPIYYS